VLVAGWKRLSTGGEEADLRLVVVRPVIQRVLEVTGLVKVFSIFPTLEEAIGD
jgi:anti-anti-sigma regulatory factor